MNSLNILLLSFLPLAIFAQDTGLYINRIPITVRYNDDKQYAYFVDDNYDSSIPNLFPHDGASIGALYEDDYSADNTQCKTTECPNLVRLFAHLNKTVTPPTTQLIDEATKKTLNSDAIPIGYIAKTAGYCSSDDTVPIFELYSEVKQTYAYWSPVNPSQYVDVSSTTLDAYRYDPVRFVGFALAKMPSRLVLTGSAPDYSNGAYASSTFTALKAVEVVQFQAKDKSYVNTAAARLQVNGQSKNALVEYYRSTGIFLLSPLNLAVQKFNVANLCGNTLNIWSTAEITNNAASRLVPESATSDLPSNRKTLMLTGLTFKKQNAGCGGIEGFAKIVEFEHKDHPRQWNYAVHADKIAEYKADGWTETGADLGYTTLDQTGLYLFPKSL